MMRISKIDTYLRIVDLNYLCKPAEPANSTPDNPKVDLVEISDDARQKIMMENLKAGRIDRELYESAISSIKRFEKAGNSDKIKKTDQADEYAGYDFSSEKILDDVAGRMLYDLFCPWWEL